MIDGATAIVFRARHLVLLAVTLLLALNSSVVAIWLCQKGLNTISGFYPFCESRGTSGFFPLETCQLPLPLAPTARNIEPNCIA